MTQDNATVVNITTHKITRPF